MTLPLRGLYLDHTFRRPYGCRARHGHASPRIALSVAIAVVFGPALLAALLVARTIGERP